MGGIEFKQNEINFKEIFEKSPIGILFYDKKGKLVKINHSAIEIGKIASLEYFKSINLFDNPYINSRKEELLKKGQIKFQAPLDLKMAKELGFSYTTEKNVLFFNYNISTTNSGFLVQIQDISEFKISEKALKDSEAHFRSLYNNSFDAILLTEPDGNILAANPAAQEMFLMSGEELIKAGREGLVAKDGLLKHAIKEREEKGRAKSELTFKRKDGSIFTGEVTSSIFTDAEGTVKTSIIIRDLTQRKKTEQELKQARNNLENIVNERTKELEKAYESLKESEERYKQFFEASPNFTVHVSLSGKIIDANRTALEILSKSKEELIGTNFTELDMVFKEDVPIHVKNFLNLLLGKPVEHYETRIKRDNEVRWGDTYPIILRKHKIPNSI